MIKKIVCMMLVFLTGLNVRAVNVLDEIVFVGDADPTVMLDDRVQSLCRRITDLWKEAGFESSDENLKTFLSSRQIDEISYEVVLCALHACMDSDWEPRTQEECDLIDSLKKMYDQLREEYDQLARQLAVRRIKCKCFTKVRTQTLEACYATIKGTLAVQDCLQVNGLTGFVRSTDGECFTAAPLTVSDLPTNIMANLILAPGSVTGGPGGTIANNTITTSNLNFSALVGFPGEPNPLTVYRGSVAAAGTTPVSGAGFTVTHTNGTGIYTITFTNPYVTSYSLFVQPTTGYGNLGTQTFIAIPAQANGSFTVNTFSSLGIPADAAFVFFTIGS